MTMWMMTVDGFYSAVRHREQRDVVMVRARSRDDLERMARRLELDGVPMPDNIVSTPNADYWWRMNLHEKVWGRYAELMAEGVNYDNFKNAVDARDSERASVYHKVWAALLRIQYGAYTNL